MRLRILTAISGILLSGNAYACGDPPESYYRAHSAAVVDGTATCDGTKRECKIIVNRVLKNDLDLRLMHRKLAVDFVKNPFVSDDPDDPIIITCGYAHFEPEFSKFAGRFYLKQDQQTGEMSAWRYLVRDQRRQLRHPIYCEAVGGLARCSDPEPGE